jgi:hypothetical protein
LTVLEREVERGAVVKEPSEARDFEVGAVGRLVPSEIVRIIYEILHHEIFRVTKGVSGLHDLIES